MKPESLFSELKRRHVLRVCAGFELHNDGNMLLVLTHPLLAPPAEDEEVRSMIDEIGIVLSA